MGQAPEMHEFGHINMCSTSALVRMVLAGNAAFVLNCAAVAQTWCPEGATWWHDYGFFFGPVGHVQTSYAGDSLIEGQSWQKLVPVLHGWDAVNNVPLTADLPVVLTRGVGALVMVREGEVEDTLYNFDAAAASKTTYSDSWSQPFTDNFQVQYLVVDTGHWIVDGVSLQWSAIDVVFGFDAIVMRDTMLERTGFLHQYIAPVFTGGDVASTRGLRCYADVDLSYQAPAISSCGLPLAVPEGSRSSLSWHAFPNPCSDVLVVRSDHTDPWAGALWLTDALGRTVAQQVWPAGQDRCVMSMRGTSPGAYWLRYRSSTGTEVMQVLVE